MQVKKNDEPIKNILKNYVRQNKISPGYLNTHIKTIWESKLGATINNYTSALKLSNGKLYVTIDSAPLRHELSMGKDKIKNLLNGEVGEEVIKEVIIQ